MSTKFLVLADNPTENELQAHFRGAASYAMRYAIRDACASIKYPMSHRDISYAYLSDQRYQGGIDTEVFPKSVLNEFNANDFFRLPHLAEDVYVSKIIWEAWLSLLRKIRLEEPDVIIASGKWVLFFLGCYPQSEAPIGRLSNVKFSTKSPNTFGLNMKFRGSTLAAYSSLELGKPCIVFPIIPHATQAMVNAPTAIAADYRRIAMFYANFSTGAATPAEFLEFSPTTTILDDAAKAKKFLLEFIEELDQKETKASIDLETVAKTIDTVGISLDGKTGYAIPLLKKKEIRVNKVEATAYDAKGKEIKVALGSVLSTYEPVFSLEDEAEIVYLLCKAFQHPNIRHIGHNYHYDAAFMYETWGIRVDPWRCTMTLASVLHNTRKKGLAFLCSLMLQNYVYWKDDLNATKSYDRWTYCAKDALNTYQLWESLERDLQALPEHNRNYYLNKQERTAKHVLSRMLKGLTVDLEMRKQVDLEFTKLHAITIQALRDIVGYELNINSTPQIRALLIDCLGIEPILDRKRKTPTFGKAAMAKYIAKHPEYGLLLHLILEAKSIHTYLSNFIRAPLDDEGQLRSFISVAGTKSFRFGSKKYLHNLGANIMNWSDGTRTSLAHSAALLSSYEDEDSIEETSQEDEADFLDKMENPLKVEVPNSKKIIIPKSREHFFVNVDLSSGDLYFVTWMSGAKWNMEVLGNGGDVYTELAKEYYKDNSITKKDPRRQKQFKPTAHALHYYGMEKTIALSTGLDINEVLRIKDFYFGKNPEIVTYYQEKIINDCVTLGYTENVFGARYFCDTTNEKLDKTWRQKMVALPAQGGVADLINEIMDRADDDEDLRREQGRYYLSRAKPALESKLQCHDAGLWQGVISDPDWKDRLESYFRVEIPFVSPQGESTPLIIPFDMGYSEVSYADCKNMKAYEERKLELLANRNTF